VEGRIVGFILANTVEKEGTAWKMYGYLSWIGVASDYQRTNLGQRLYNKLEDILEDDGVRMVIADTEAENFNAIEFFKAMGFSIRADHTWLAKTLQRKHKRSKKDAGNDK
jgi:ribosomal protein S18 acetylase RimI-like enzyme